MNLSRGMSLLLRRWASDIPKTVYVTEGAPSTPGQGLFAQSVSGFGRNMYISGQLGVDAGGELAPGVEAQAKAAMVNLERILKSAGVDTSNVVKTNLYLTKMEDFTKVEGIVADAFPKDSPPASSVCAVYKLPRGADFEIEAVAILPYSNCDAY